MTNYPDKIYPDEKQLRKIEKWDVLKRPVIDLLSYIQPLWTFGETAFIRSGESVMYLQLHTVGWEGNEAIIEALQNNDLFWRLYWQKTERGGHYYFKFRPLRKTTFTY